MSRGTQASPAGWHRRPEDGWSHLGQESGNKWPEKKTCVEAESGKQLGLCRVESILQLELKLQGSNRPEPLHRGGRASPAEPRGPCEESGFS